jgi:hypothetical protein
LIKSASGIKALKGVKNLTYRCNDAFFFGFYLNKVPKLS